MKTFIFISALACNILLCINPFTGATETLLPKEGLKPVSRVSAAVPQQEGLSYSKLLKSKAASLKVSKTTINP